MRIIWSGALLSEKCEKERILIINKIQFSLESRFFFFLIDSISLFPRNQRCLRNPRPDIFLIFIKRRIFQFSLRRDMVFLDF